MRFKNHPILELRRYLQNASLPLPAAASSFKFADLPVMLRLQDKSHRNLYRTLETEALRYKKGESRGKIFLRPNIPNFLVWLHKRTETNPNGAVLGNPVVPSSIKEPVVMEIAMFHILTSLFANPDDHKWLEKLSAHLDALLARVRTQRKFKKLVGRFTEQNARELAQSLGCTVLRGKLAVLCKALDCISIISNRIATISDIQPWISSILAPSIPQACKELANLSEIPAFVTSDILLRTPLSRGDLHLQLDLWRTFQPSIGKAYHQKTTHLSSIVRNLSLFCIHHDLQQLTDFIQSSVDFFTSTRSGFAFKLFDTAFTNNLIYLLAFYYLLSSAHSHEKAMCVIRAQEILAKHLTHPNLNQEGFMGVVLAMAYVSETKAHKLLDISHLHYPQRSIHFYIAQIHVSTTPEQLLHSFNAGMAQYPNSASMWLVFVRTLEALELLSEPRSHKLLHQLLARKDSLILSKDIVQTLLRPIQSITSMEKFVQILQQQELLPKFRALIHVKYMSLLYRYSGEKSVCKPYLDQQVRASNNLECARFLFHQNLRKTIAFIGIMLNGEVEHQPENIYSLYTRYLQGKSPDQQCLVALLRACIKKQNGNFLIWGTFFAPQVAVHEFKQHVAQKVPHTKPSEGGLVPTNKVWKLYIEVLAGSSYLAELAEIIRWWEEVHFVPGKSTLLLLLRALPRNFAERHIKHALSVPTDKDFLLLWPWPSLEEL